MIRYEIDLSYWLTEPYEQCQIKLEQQLREIRKDVYAPNDRVVLKHTGDLYVKKSKLGLILRNIQTIVNEVDISNAFVLIESTNPHISHEVELLSQISQDPVPVEFKIVNGTFHLKELQLHPLSRKENYAYGSINPLKISLENISDREKYLLSKSKTFCIYPWIHMHAWPTGEAMPCCMADPVGQLGNCRKSTLKEIWNNQPMRDLRVNMLNDAESAACSRCYEQERAGFFSGRQSANKHHGHLIERVLETKPDGTYDTFELSYWDIRFSNLCNLKCRSCGHIFSSQWYQDQVKLAGPEWAKTNKPKVYAGRYETDMLEQLLEHIDYVEQIYFAGGEPLVMEEHYIILDELIKRGKTDVRLIYNTNFTQVKLKDKHAFEQWKHFPAVAVGASLDAMGKLAEYIRSGTKWDVVEENRKLMMEMCPHVDFYISPTLSIMNAMHIVDFHRDWVDKGFIRPQDLNVNILQDPPYYRIDIATPEYKEKVRKKLQEHIEWLKPQDHLRRATQGFESAINFLNKDNSQLLQKFWDKTRELDSIRNENVLDYVPELKALL